jgi:hypothetical protein
MTALHAAVDQSLLVADRLLGRYGVMSYNPHVVGRELLTRDRRDPNRCAWRPEAAKLETPGKVRQGACRWGRRILTAGACWAGKTEVHRPFAPLNIPCRFPKHAFPARHCLAGASRRDVRFG